MTNELVKALAENCEKMVIVHDQMLDDTLSENAHFELATMAAELVAEHTALIIVGETIPNLMSQPVTPR